MNEDIQAKNEQLGQILRGMGRVMVSFSGGVDSSLVLKRAQEELGEDVMAVVVASELFRDEEFDHAVKLAKSMGVAVYETRMQELSHPAIVAHNPDSWYYSKQMLYSHLNDLATELKFPYVIDGMIMDDLEDFRPGFTARDEAGVRSVLQEANIYKTEVRELAKSLYVPVWDKSASCSLASRIPYGNKVTLEKIKQIEAAERVLLELGFSQVRVRHHGNMARIEVTPSQIPDLMTHREQVDLKLKKVGFTYVSVDLAGYQTGNMNQTVPTEVVEKFKKQRPQ